METCKIVFTGDINVGKTSLIIRYIDNDFKEKPTVNVDYMSKQLHIKGRDVRVELWDTAGQERFRTITSSYYKGAQAVILVYDCTNSTSFTNLSHWMTESERCAAETANIILLANKRDLNDSIAVTKDQGQQFANEFGIPFYEVSAKTGENVDKFFEDIISQIISESNAAPTASEKSTVNVGGKKSGSTKKSTCSLL